MSNIDYQHILTSIYNRLNPVLEDGHQAVAGQAARAEEGRAHGSIRVKDARVGHVAAYIPELACVDPDQLGMSLQCLDGAVHHVGDADVTFSVQSIAKVPALLLALTIDPDEIWERMDVEPSGNAFNSLFQLEYEQGVPRNPLINAGALVVCDVLISALKRPLEELYAFVHALSGDKSITWNERVARSEREASHRNAALVNLMKSFGNIHNEPDEVLDLYVRLCAMEMTCTQLACTFGLLANEGRTLHDGRALVPPVMVQRVNAVMQTCGFYDEAGEFAYRVGLPGKSGVGGGIVAIHPRYYSVAVWSPRLNERGNSHLGMRALELLTADIGHTIF